MNTCTFSVKILGMNVSNGRAGINLCVDMQEKVYFDITCMCMNVCVYTCSLYICMHIYAGKGLS